MSRSILLPLATALSVCALVAPRPWHTRRTLAMVFSCVSADGADLSYLDQDATWQTASRFTPSGPST